MKSSLRLAARESTGNGLPRRLKQDVAPNVTVRASVSRGGVTKRATRDRFMAGNTATLSAYSVFAARFSRPVLKPEPEFG